MASPLILKIQTLLDDKGFKQFQRGIGATKKGIISLGSTIGALSGVVTGLGIALGAVFSGDQVRRIVRLAAELERSQTQLESFLAITIDDADIAAQSFRRLAREMSETSTFAQVDLLRALRELTRGFKDPDDAARSLGAAMEIAAANGIGVAQAARAISNANQGLVISLVRLTGFTREEIQEFRELGTLAEELSKRFDELNAVARDVETLGGALENLRNRIIGVRTELGEPLLVPLREFAKLINSIPDAIIEFTQVAAIFGGLGVTFRLLALAAVPFAFAISAAVSALILFGVVLLKIKRQEEEVNAELLELTTQLNNANLVVGKTTSEFTKLFDTIEKERRAIGDGFKFLEQQEQNVLRTLEKVRKALETAEGAERERLLTQEKTGESGRKILLQQKQTLEDRLKLLEQGQRAVRIQGKLDEETLGEEFQKLTLSQIEFQKKRLEEDIKNSIARLEAEGRSAEQITLISRNLTNSQIAFSQLLLKEELTNIRQRLSANQELLDIFERTISPLDADATDLERGRQRDRILQLQREQLKLSEEEEDSARKILAIQIKNNEITDTEAGRRGRLIDLRTRERELDILRETKERLEEIGDIESRRNVTATLEKRIATRERELRNRLAEVRREGFGALSPDEASAVDEVTRRIQRELELQRFQIEINLGIDVATLERKIDAALAGRLREAGFIAESSASASTEVDIPPEPTVSEFDAFGKFINEAFMDVAPKEL